MNRSLALDTVEASETTVSAALKALARKFFFSNKDANASKKIADTARVDLLRGMDEAGIKSFSFQSTAPEGGSVPAGNSVTLTVTIDAKETDRVNIEKLVEKIGWLEFAKVAKVGKGDLVKAFGAKLAAEVCESIAGEPNVNVKGV